jgi:hypothetical protein
MSRKKKGTAGKILSFNYHLKGNQIQVLLVRNNGSSCPLQVEYVPFDFTNPPTKFLYMFRDSPRNSKINFEIFKPIKLTAHKPNMIVKLDGSSELFVNLGRKLYEIDFNLINFTLVCF